MLTALLTASACLVLRSQTQPVFVLDLNGLKSHAEESIESRRNAWDTLQAASALEGLANRNGVKLYLSFVGKDGAIDGYWLRRLRSTWLKGAPIVELHSLDEALLKLRSSYNGVVVWDERVPATSNIASTMAGVENLLPVRFDLSAGSLYRRWVVDVEGPKLPVRQRLFARDGGPMFTGTGEIPGSSRPSTGSAKCDAYLWAAENFLRSGRCTAGWMAYYPDSHWLAKPNQVPLERTLLTNHDFFISNKAFFFDLSPWDDEAPDDDPAQKPGTDAATLQSLLGAEYRLNAARFTHVGGFVPWDQKYTDFTGRKHGGVATEWRYAEILTCFNAFMDADAPGLHAMANASVFTHEPLKETYPQKNLPTMASLAKKGYLLPDGSVASKTYVSIYAGDYDSAAWLYNMMPTVWDDPKRGDIPLGWAFNPVLDARFPTGLVYARETATPNDFFISGDSGAGYLNPGYLVEPRKWSGYPSGLAAWQKFSKAEFNRWNLSIVGFVIDGNAPPMDDAVKLSYTKFAPDGVVAQKVPPLSMVGETPFLRMGSDLPQRKLEEAAKLIIQSLSGDEPSFHIYRTILWTASQHEALFRRVEELRPDIEFVDPYTLMMLAKRSLEPKAH